MSARDVSPEIALQVLKCKIAHLDTELATSQLIDAARLEGVAVAFGLMGMAEEINRRHLRLNENSTLRSLAFRALSWGGSHIEQRCGDCEMRNMGTPRNFPDWQHEKDCAALADYNALYRAIGREDCVEYGYDPVTAPLAGDPPLK